MKKQVQKSIIPAVAIVVAGLLGLITYLNRTYLLDLVSSFSYSATPELSAIENSLGLTSSAELILHASHPSLDSREDFNTHCNSHDEQISILGCYTNKNIYIYNIEESELSGVKESTMAHELLHAAWARMSVADRSRVSELLANVYNDSEYHDQLAEDLEIYDDDERVEELHSRIGTEIASLPAELETHYAKYFKDQDAVVDYYESYITPFRELSSEIENLSNKLETLSAEIEEKTKAYYADAEKLSADIDKFNTCASTVGCFATDAAFYASRSQLVSRQDKIEAAYDSLNNMINSYNTMVKKYNENILRGETLESIINSNAKVESIK